MTEIIAEFFIGLNTASTKNGASGMDGISYKSKSARFWLKYTEHQFHLQRSRFIEVTKDLPRPLYVEFTFIRSSKRKFDYPNPLQSVFDGMKNNGWIIDDNMCEIKPYFGDYIYDKEYHGCLIKIFKTKPII